MTEETTKQIRKRKKLKPYEWEQIVLLWETGKATAQELADLFDVTKQAISSGLKARGSVKGSRSHEIGVAGMEAIKADQQKFIERVHGMKEQFLNYSDIIAKLTMKEIMTAAKSSIPLSEQKDNLIALDRASNIIARVRGENYHLLGLNDDNTLEDQIPEIALTEYSEDEIIELQKSFEQVEEELKGSSLDQDEDEDGPEIPFGDEDDDTV